ncbi:MAG: hypothetical protein IKY31_01585 [Bacteroidaceae bacterium]|nr:hypothetical protein [Bacteroidaceae bacterium]
MNKGKETQKLLMSHKQITFECYCLSDVSSLPRRWQYTASTVADLCQSTLAEKRRGFFTQTTINNTEIVTIIH